MEARHSSIEQLQAQCRAIVAALLTSARREDEGPLHEELLRLLAETDARGEDAHAWQAAISTLHLHADELMRDVPGVDHGWFMGLLDHARVEISEEVQRHTTRALLQHVDMMSALGLLTAQLIASQDMTETCDILARHLPLLGIDTFLVALFRGDEDDPVAESEVVMAGGLAPAAGTLTFASRQFPPRDAYPADGPMQLLVLPLRVDEDSFGFVALPTTALEPGAAIVSNLATAIRASRLYQDAVHGRQLAEDAARLKSRFLSMVSHELRTPLSMVVGLSDMVLRESRESGTLTEAAIGDLGRLATSAQHLGRLIGDVLDLASSEAGQLRLVRQPIDIGELVLELGAVGERMAREKGLDWRFEQPAPGTVVMGDRTRLRQVVLNLLANAVKYTEQGSVALAMQRARPRGDDHGVRYGPRASVASEQAHVFDEFYRSERAAAGGSGYGSLGLGLAIARQLVQHHGGRIEVESPGELGAGSTFRVTLPLVAATEVESPAAGGGEVLILSRHDDVDDRLAAGLRESGVPVRVEVLAAGGGSTRARHPDPTRGGRAGG